MWGVGKLVSVQVYGGLERSGSSNALGVFAGGCEIRARDEGRPHAEAQRAHLVAVAQEGVVLEVDLRRIRSDFG